PQCRAISVAWPRPLSMNFCRAGTLLSPLQMAESSAVTPRSSTFLSTTLSGFIFSADAMVNETPIPPATRLSIVVGLVTSCTMFLTRKEKDGSRLEPLGVTEVVDDDFRDDEAEAHRQNDRDGGHAVSDRCRKKLQGRIRAGRELDEAARHSEEKHAGHHGDDRGKADRGERHVPATGDRSEDESDRGAGNERAGRYTKTNGKGPPPQGMSEHPDRDRPAEHA